jgi:hypothetical protein
VVLEHDFDFRPFLHAVLRAAAGEGEDEFQNHHSRLRWIWLMHALDLAFNIFPALHPVRYPLQWLWLPLGTLLFMGGFLAAIFLKKFNAIRRIRSATRACSKRWASAKTPSAISLTRKPPEAADESQTTPTAPPAPPSAFIIASLIFAVLAVA